MYVKRIDVIWNVLVHLDMIHIQHRNISMFVLIAGESGVMMIERRKKEQFPQKNDLKRCEYSLSLPITQTTKHTRQTTQKINKETEYNKKPQRDDELRNGLDMFQHRFKCVSFVAMIELINGDETNAFDIDLNWIYKALATRNKSDPIRKDLLAYIDTKLK